MPKGIIVKGIGGFYYVKTNEGIYECKARGVFRKENITPLPGDRVSITIDATGKTGSIKDIHQRDTQLVRPAVANISQMIAVVAIKSPAPDLVLLDKLLVTSEIKGVSTIICLNKVDLALQSQCEEFAKAYEKAGYKTVMTSLQTVEGYSAIRDMLHEKITVFAGQSGVGKSTILNALMNSSVMQTGKISEKIERGKHTTRHAELVEIKTGGYIVDTPGFSSFELEEVEHGELELYYPEFSQYINKCKYTGCSHMTEPGCVIKQAVKDGIIDDGRYERYIQLYNILKQNKPFKAKGNKTQGKWYK